MNAKETRKNESLEMLHKLVKPGDTIYTVLRSVSRSGMQRRIDVYAIVDNRPVYLSGYVANVLGYRRASKGHWAIIVNGCGMDMGYHIVNSLSMAMFCPDKYDHDAAYSLKHEWI